MALKSLGKRILSEVFDGHMILKEILLNHVIGCTLTSWDLAALMSPITEPTLSKNSSLEVIIHSQGRFFV